MSDIPDNEEDFTPAPRRNTGKLVLVVIVVTLLAIWLVPGEETPTEPIAPPSESAPLPLPDNHQNNPEPTPATTEIPPEEATPQMAGDAARNLIQELDANHKADLDRAFSAAQQEQQQGTQEDAYLLYFFAARAGHSEAALTLAQAADPAHFTPDGLYPAADPGQAYKWYKKAAENGEPQATPALQTLRETLTAAAAQGDTHAQQMILQWK